MSGLVVGCLDWWLGAWICGEVSGLVVGCLDWRLGVWTGGGVQSELGLRYALDFPSPLYLAILGPGGP